MTSRWNLDEHFLEVDSDMIYASPDSKTESNTTTSQGLTSPAAFANMCLLSGGHNFQQTFGGMYGLLAIMAGPKNVKFIENELELPVPFDNIYYDQFKPKQVNCLADIYFGHGGKYKASSIDVSKGYKSWVKDSEFEFKNLHNRRALVQLGISLCSLGKDVYVDRHYTRLVNHWLFSFTRCFGMDTAILLESLPLQGVLADLYNYFANHLKFRSRLFSFILKYANKPRNHPFTKLCAVVAHLLKFSELEHVCLITEHFGPFLMKKEIHNLLNGDLMEPFALFVAFFSDMKAAIPNFEENYKYAMLLFPTKIEHLVRDQSLLILTYLAMKFVDNPSSIKSVCNQKVIREAERHGELGDLKQQQEFLTQVLLYYIDISHLYEGIRSGARRTRKDLKYHLSDIENVDNWGILLDWLVICGSTKVENEKV